MAKLVLGINKRLSSKAQAAMEYLMIAGFVMLIMLPLVYLVYNYTQESGADIVNAQITKLGRDLVNNAESVYYFSSPSKITLDFNMPRGVHNITIQQNPLESGCKKCTELVFLVQQKEGKAVLTFSTNVDIRTETYDDTTKSSAFNSTAFTEGLKHFNIQAKKDHVLITTGG